MPIQKALFNLGQITMTRSLWEKCNENHLLHRFVIDCLKRHHTGDFGDCSHHDKEVNLFAIKNDERIFSSYILKCRLKSCGHNKIWIITEADRSVTTAMFPSDY